MLRTLEPPFVSLMAPMRKDSLFDSLFYPFHAGTTRSTGSRIRRACLTESKLQEVETAGVVRVLRVMLERTEQLDAEPVEESLGIEEATWQSQLMRTLIVTFQVVTAEAPAIGEAEDLVNDESVRPGKEMGLR